MSFGKGFLRPAPRRRVDFVRKDTDGDRNFDVLWRKEGELILPVEAGRRDCRPRQPIERDVVEDIVSGQALGVALEDPGYKRIAARVVVEHPGRQSHRRVFERVQGLWAVCHFLGVAQTMLVEEVELIKCILLVGTGRPVQGRQRRGL